MITARSLLPGIATTLLALTGCGGGSASSPPAAPPTAQPGAPADSVAPFDVVAQQRFDEPWAMVALPDGRFLVTEKRGALKLVEPGVRVGEIRGAPAVAYGGQGGLGDVALHPGFAGNRWIYLSYAEADDAGSRGAAVARATLALDDAGGGSLSDLRVVWRQQPKVDGSAHYGHRVAFDTFGKLWISSGERMQGEPAQDPQSALGKLLRVNDDGSVPDDNPFATQGGVAAQVWTLGHRNPLGLAFDAQGQLWIAEMGPRGGDELNRVRREANYGWPRVSEGDNYDGSRLPRHASAPRFAAPDLAWNPVISPGSLIFYTGSEFPQWRGQALLAGLTAQALVRVAVDDTGAREVARHPLGARVREIEQRSDGSLWVLEDGAGGRLLQLRARR